MSRKLDLGLLFYAQHPPDNDRDCSRDKAKERAHFGGLLHRPGFKRSACEKERYGETDGRDTANDKQINRAHAFGQTKPQRVGREPTKEQHARRFPDQEPRQHEPRGLADRRK